MEKMSLEEFLEKDWFVWKGFCIPDYMRPALYRYIFEHIPPGGFLSAVICNDLYTAVLRADINNLYNIPAYVAFFMNHAPMDCWGSKKKFWNWIGGKENV